MVMRLEKVVPFGRSFDEYIKMFNLRGRFKGAFSALVMVQLALMQKRQNGWKGNFYRPDLSI